jgi:hypothetical protein
MPETPEQFAIIPLPADAPLPRDAIAAGKLEHVLEYLPDSATRRDMAQLASDVAERIEQEQALARQRERAEANSRNDMIQRLRDGIAQMTKRMDSLEAKRGADARDARRKARADIEAALPDPDAADAAEVPNVRPGLTEGHEPGEASFEYVEDESELPSGLGVFGPPGGGTEPELPGQMAHPQPASPLTAVEP